MDKILKDLKPADLPVDRPAPWDLRVHLRTARALGWVMSQSGLVQATENLQ